VGKQKSKEREARIMQRGIWLQLIQNSREKIISGTKVRLQKQYYLRFLNLFSSLFVLIQKVTKKSRLHQKGYSGICSATTKKSKALL